MPHLASLAVAVGALPGAPAPPPVTVQAASSCADADVVPTPDTLDDARRATRCLLNRERAKRGLPALRAGASLGRAAQRHSRSMTGRHYFGHVEPDGDTLVDRVRATSYLDGASSWRLGETLAWGAAQRGAPAAIANALMRSDEHADIILTASFRDVGVGVVPETPLRVGWDGPAATYTAVFGVRD
jgi:uncharacterized protein YkwD